MPIDLYEAVVSGKCDFCGGDFSAGDSIAQPEGDEVMCSACVLGLLELEAS